MEGAVEVVAWSDSGGWQPLEENKHRDEFKKNTSV